MDNFREEIDNIDQGFERLIEKYLKDRFHAKEATDARETMCPCVRLMDEILAEVKAFNRDVNAVMNEERFGIDPDATVEAFEKFERIFENSTAPEVVKEQVIIQRDKLRMILDNILDALDKIARAQRADADASIGG